MMAVKIPELCAAAVLITEDNPLQKNEQIKTPIMQYAGFRSSK
jgi:hypothetical protein